MKKTRPTTAARPAAIEKRASDGQTGSVNGCPMFVVAAKGTTSLVVGKGSDNIIRFTVGGSALTAVKELSPITVRHLAHWLLAVAQDEWQPNGGAQ